MPLMQPYMNDDDYQAEMDLHTLKQASEITPEREQKARLMAEQKAKELADLAKVPMGPRKSSEMMSKGYMVVKGDK